MQVTASNEFVAFAYGLERLSFAASSSRTGVSEAEETFARDVMNSLSVFKLIEMRSSSAAAAGHTDELLKWLESATES
ncbi:MAG: hypothetical protein ACKERG_03400 [Candidatus Hodgkinia cicadicola]